VSDEQDETQGTPPPPGPAPEAWARNEKGQLTTAARARAREEVLRCVQSGLPTANAIAAAIKLSRQTVAGLMQELGFTSGSGNRNGDGKLTLRASGPEVETPKAKAKRKAKEAAAKKLLAKEEARLRKLADAPPKAPKPDPPPKAPPLIATRAELEAEPDPPDLVLPGDPPRKRGGIKGTVKDRVEGNPSPNDPSIDKVALVQVPPSYDEIERLRKISLAPWIDSGQQIAALRILVGIRANKGKIDWSTVTPDQIPEEMRHRLAGMLLGWVDIAELPEQVRAAPLLCRQVYKLTGVLPGTVEAAEAVMERWAGMRLELREVAGEARVELGLKAAPLELTLAAETAYVAPQWEMN
jgi:hypothetical protein